MALADFFFAGAWLQPVQNFPYIRDTLGCNFNVGFETGGVGGPFSRANYKAAAIAASIKLVMPGYVFGNYSLAAALPDIGDVNVVAWSHPDELDRDSIDRIPPSDVASQTAAMKAADPTKLVFINFDGIQLDGKIAGWNTYDYATAIVGADLLSFDLHLTNTGYQPAEYDVYRQVCVYLKSLLGVNQKLLTCVEVGWENLLLDPFWGSTANPRKPFIRRPAPADILYEYQTSRNAGAMGSFSFLTRVGAHFEDFADVSTEDATQVKSLNDDLKAFYASATPIPTPTPNPTPTPTGQVPGAPFGLALKVISSVEIDLAWINNSATADGYIVDKKIGAGSWTTVATLPSTATSYISSGLTASTSYTFRVHAYNSFGPSYYTGEVLATTLASGSTAPTPTATKPKVRFFSGITYTKQS